MDETKLHPFDFDKLHKGTWIEIDELEAAACCKANSPDFQLRVLALRGEIELRTGILSRFERWRLRLMTDSEATVWATGQAHHANRQLQRTAHRLTHNVDRSQLSTSERVKHDHVQRVVSAMAAASAREARRAAMFFALTPRLILDDSDSEEDA